MGPMEPLLDLPLPLETEKSLILIACLRIGSLSPEVPLMVALFPGPVWPGNKATLMVDLYG